MTQITLANGYSTKNMVFEKPREEKNGGLKNFRIPIKTKYPDGSQGDFILATEECFSFGLAENKDFNNPDVSNGYVLPLNLWDRDGPSPPQKEWYDTFIAIINKCKKHVVSVRNEIGKFDLEETDSELKKLNPAYIKKDKETGKVVDGRGPTLYVKLFMSSPKKKGPNGEKDVKIFTRFYDANDNLLDHTQLMGQRCKVRAAIRIESIFIGSKISIQIKLIEACVEMIEQSTKRLLPKMQADTSMKEALENPFGDDAPVVAPGGPKEEDAGSLNGDDEEEAPPPPKVEEPEPPKKKKERRVKNVE